MQSVAFLIVCLILHTKFLAGTLVYVHFWYNRKSDAEATPTKNNHGWQSHFSWVTGVLIFAS